MTRVLPVRLRSRRRAAVASAAAFAVAASLLPALALSGAGGSGSASALPAAAPSRGLSAETFADPPSSVRPMYRWWMPLAYTDDEVLRDELRDIAASGGGGVEVSPFIVPGAGNQTNAFLKQYGWGTPAWAHKIEVITEEAAKLGLIVDQNLGPQYPATVPTLNSFNQPEVEQQLRFGREFNDAGTTRSGALPAPATAAPSVTAKLCGAASPDDEVLKVETLGGLAAGDTITVGTGATAEKVVVTGLGDRTAACGDLSVSAVQQLHAVAEPVVNVAKSTRIKTLVAQCAAACGVSTTGPIALAPDSVTDVTIQVTSPASGGKLSYTFPTGNGNPWVVIDFLQTAVGSRRSERRLHRRPSRTTSSTTGVAAAPASRATSGTRTSSPTPSRANIDKIGGGAVFEDSLELGIHPEVDLGLPERLREPPRLRPHDPAARARRRGTPGQRNSRPSNSPASVRRSARTTGRRSATSTRQRTSPRCSGGQRGHGLTFRAQAYGTPIQSGVAPAATGIPEGESLNFGAGNNAARRRGELPRRRRRRPRGRPQRRLGRVLRHLPGRLTAPASPARACPASSARAATAPQSADATPRACSTASTSPTPAA